MMLSRLIKNIIIGWKDYLEILIWLSKLQKKYPTCKFYPDVKISNCNFNQYNVIFNNVALMSCNIGSHTYIQKNATVFNAEIGKFCSIASNVSIGPGIHPVEGVSTHPSFYLTNTPLVKKFASNDLISTFKTINIGHDVWIGEKAIIMDGVNIGTGAIIAAGAIVTKDVEPYSIVGGVPAKIIKYRFNPETIQKIMHSQWWNKTDEWLKKHQPYFLQPKLFISKMMEEKV